MFRLPRLPSIPPAALGPILLISLLVLLIFGLRPQPRPRLAPPSAVPGFLEHEWSPWPGSPRPSPVPPGAVQAQRDLLTLSSAEGLFADPQPVTDAASQALAYTIERTAMQPAAPINVYLGNEPSCNLNGIAYTNERMVQVFTCPDLDQQRAINILAHEYVHQLAHDYYGEPHLHADVILMEGIATWGAGRYWLGEHADFRAFVRTYYPRAGLLPLATSYEGRPVADMNQLYYQWAAFVEYLIGTYGRNSFDALYVSGSREPGSADYRGVYGKSLEELEAEWLVWLDA